jgi:hypothetical protein
MAGEVVGVGDPGQPPPDRGHAETVTGDGADVPRNDPRLGGQRAEPPLAAPCAERLEVLPVGSARGGRFLVLGEQADGFVLVRVGDIRRSILPRSCDRH